MRLSHSNSFICTIISHHFNCLLSPFNTVFIHIHLIYNYFKGCILTVCFLLPVWQQISYHTSTVWNMAQQNSQTKELTKLGANFSSINITNSRVTHSKSKVHHKKTDQIDGSLLLPVWVENSSNDQGTVPGAAVLPNLHSPILKNSHYITLSDEYKHFIKIRCYFHSQEKCLLDYFNNPLPDGAVLYASDIPFWYSKKEGKYTEVLDNPTWNIFLVTSRDYEFLISHKNTVLHTSAESWWSSLNDVKNPNSSTTAHVQLPPSNPNDPLLLTYMKENWDALV